MLQLISTELARSPERLHAARQQPFGPIPGLQLRRTNTVHGGACKTLSAPLPSTPRALSAPQSSQRSWTAALAGTVTRLLLGAHPPPPGTREAIRNRAASDREENIQGHAVGSAAGLPEVSGWIPAAALMWWQPPITTGTRQSLAGGCTAHDCMSLHRT